MPFSTEVTLIFLLWIGVSLVLMPLMYPIRMFVSQGWAIRKQEFTNRIDDKDIGLYLKRFWNIRSDEISKTEKSPYKQFSMIYDDMAGRKLFIFPSIVLAMTTILFGGLVVSTSIKFGYAQYENDFFQLVQHPTQSAESATPPEMSGAVRRIKPGDLANLMFPFSAVDVNLTALTSISGAYLYAFGVIIFGYRTRTLVSFDLWWCTFRLLIAVPLGLSVALLGNDSLGPFIGFALGAFPMDAITRVLRRSAAKTLNVDDSSSSADTLINIVGATQAIVSRLEAEGIDSIQQLVGVDPISLALRAGLPFDFVIYVVSQAVVWLHLGEQTSEMVKCGLGDAKKVLDINQRLTENDEAATQLVQKVAESCNISADIIQFQIQSIANDKYAVFLAQFAS